MSGIRAAHEGRRAACEGTEGGGKGAARMRHLNGAQGALASGTCKRHLSAAYERRRVREKDEAGRAMRSKPAGGGYPREDHLWAVQAACEARDSLPWSTEP